MSILSAGMREGPCLVEKHREFQPPWYQTNPERQIDMVSEAVGKFRAVGHVLLPEQRAIYFRLGERLRDKWVLEAGCGIGVGTNTLAFAGCKVRGTDVHPDHVAFAQILYPQIDFRVWNIKRHPFDQGTPQCVVAVEVIEHIENPEIGLRNLIASATESVWFSSPNRNNPNLGQHKPHNDFHVCEYTPEEFMGMLVGRKVTIHHPYSFVELSVDTEVTPLVYKVEV